MLQRLRGVRPLRLAAPEFETVLRGIDQKFEPEDCFIGFLHQYADFCNEFGLRPGTANSSVICCHRRARPQYLSAQDTAFFTALYRAKQSDNSYRETLSPRLERLCCYVRLRSQTLPSATTLFSAAPYHSSSSAWHTNHSCSNFGTTALLFRAGRAAAAERGWRRQQ